MSDKHLDKARDAVKKKNYEYAVHLFIAYLTTHPADVAVRKELREAERSWKRMSGGGGFFAGAKTKALGMKVATIAVKKDPEKAMLACEEVLKQDPEVIPALIKLGEAAHLAKYSEVAISAFEDALAVDKDCKDALRAMGRTYKDMGTANKSKPEMEKALKCFQRLARLDPKDKEAEDETKNIPAAMTAITIKEGVDKGGYQNLIDKDEAQALEKQSQRVRTPEQALERISELEPKVEKNPKDTKTMRLIAELYVKAERPEDALAWCDKALAADPNDFLASELRGDLLMTRYETGIKQLEEAYRKSPDERVKAKLGKARQEKLAFEIDEYRKRVEAHPTEMGLRYQLGKALYDAEKIDEAIPELQKAKQDPRKKSEAGYYLGYCFVKKKMAKLAVNELNAARDGLFEMEGIKKDITYLLGRIYEMAGKKDQAVTEYSQIAEVDFGFKDVTKRLEDLS
ncbi:MAG: tetratricopeptide repeat protein [Planctomycetota bacterium]|nr:tetratricopeptide repeat protein [Planctomycetota bacterium]